MLNFVLDTKLFILLLSHFASYFSLKFEATQFSDTDFRYMLHKLEPSTINLINFQ